MYLFVKEGLKKLCWHIIFVEQAAHVEGLVPEATLSEELVKTGLTERNAKMQAQSWHQCFCVGV